MAHFEAGRGLGGDNGVAGTCSSIQPQRIKRP